MSRIARIVLPGIPHHVTQRGNRRQTIFAEESDYAEYCDLLAQRCRALNVAIWSYCLMPNHVHLILVPQEPDALARVVGETHRRYSGYLNAQMEVTGHVFQGRFGSIAMDERHFIAAARYIALNPVTAGMVARAEDWRWSSARAHLSGQDDALVTTRPVLDRVGDFAWLLDSAYDEPAEYAVRTAATIGRPLMDDAEMRKWENKLDRPIRPRKRGPKPKNG